MERISRNRAIAIILFFVLILSFFSVRLFKLQVIEASGKDNTVKFVSQTRVKAARGDILDRNGNVLVGNRASYDLVINHDVIKSATGTNTHLYKLIHKCWELGIEYIDHFPMTKDRPYEYTLADYTTAWPGYSQDYLLDEEETGKWAQVFLSICPELCVLPHITELTGDGEALLPNVFMEQCVFMICIY